MSFIVDNKSVSFESSRTDLEVFLASQSDASQWSTFFDSTSGRRLVDIVAALLAFGKFDTITARRETYMQNALSRGSIVGGAQRLGYSSFRGRNAILTLTFTPLNSGVYQRFDIIGTIKNLDLIVDADTVYNAGTPVTLDVVVGSLLTQSVISNTDKLNVFRYTQKNVSNDLRMFIDIVEVPYSEDSKELLNNKFSIQSNPLGSVDARYLNASGGTIYNVGTSVKLEYIELNDLAFILSDIKLDATEGVLTNSSIKALFVEPETNTAIQVNAPLHNETQKVIRAREDQPKILKTLDGTIIDATGLDKNSAEMIIYYLRLSGFLFNQTEILALVASFETFRPHGIKPPEIQAPTRIKIQFKIDITPSTIVGPTTLNTQLITQAHANKLQEIINLNDLEAAIEALSSVKVARVSYTGSQRLDSTAYEIGESVTAFPDTGRLYIALEILYFSDLVEPVWPLVSNTTIIDNQLVWKAIPKNDTAGIPDWSANTAYKLSNQVKPTTPNGYIYEVVELINLSNSVEPTWTPLGGNAPSVIEGSFIVDNDIVWLAREQQGAPTAWLPSTKYSKGDTVVAINQTASDNINLMWQAFAYVGKSNVTQPVMSSILGSLITDNRIVWQVTDTLVINKALNKNEYATITENITLL